MTDSIEARVARGAAWLDEHEPGGERKIDLASLDLADSSLKLAQVWGAYHEWFHQLRPSALQAWRDSGYADEFHWPGQHGFAAIGRLAALDEAWIALLKERFASGTLSDGA